jgi:ATP-dependent DNA helicase RecQ
VTTETRSGREHASDEILAQIERYWGYNEFRPLQEEAIRAGLKRRDSLTVLPTGGGKSLCYQVPPLLTDRLDVVVSPLISLMKDQVDGLRACGYPAAALHSGLSPTERFEAERFIASGDCRLAFVSPERILQSSFLELTRSADVRDFAIDEAHCISHWGHDFRPEYRQLARLKQIFPGTAFHAFTATATERVRSDIVEQLQLEDPAIHVGCFDRPNLVYRVVPSNQVRRQVESVVERHHDEAVIVYCISRADTERLATHLREKGVAAVHYHAGMDPDDRRATQEAFAREEVNVVVATVAFGMGIDRSNVRCVVHAAMPKSIEHYQQETGRAGRDGLEAECVLFYSAAASMRWRSLIEKSAEEVESSPELVEAAFDLLEHMRRFCTPGRCRHQTLSEYFGQEYTPKHSQNSQESTTNGCGACDVCLGEGEELEDGTVPAQMILSCVARVGQNFGAGHLSDILRGTLTDRVQQLGHDRLSTFGLMDSTTKTALTQMIYQLLDQGLIERTRGEFPVLQLNAVSWEVLRGQREVQLMPSSRRKKVKTTAHEAKSWDGVNRDLFENLRELRSELATERKVPPYVIFSDASLRDMARQQPRSVDSFLEVHGVGEKKLRDFGDLFLNRIAQHLVTEN